MRALKMIQTLICLICFLGWIFQCQTFKWLTQQSERKLKFWLKSMRGNKKIKGKGKVETF